MPYITSIERMAREEGIEEGIQQGRQEGMKEGLREGLRQGLLCAIELGLQLKFGTEGLRLYPEIAKIKDVYVLRAIMEGCKIVNTLPELRSIYQKFQC